MAKIEQFLFYLLLITIPLQTRKILYYSGWYYNEWQAIGVYFTDLLLLALFLFWLTSSYSKLLYYVSSIKYDGTNLKYLIHNTKFLILKPDFWLVLFLIAAGVSVKNSSDFYIGFFQWLKLLEFVVFYFYLKTYAIRKFNFMKMLYILILGGVFQAVIGIGQFLKQGDLGLRLLGESVIGLHLIGIASFLVASGEKVIRAYGTTPHPNVLAAHLFLTVFAIYFLVLYSKHESLIFWAYPVILFGMFFTFSRIVLFLWAAGFLIRGVIGFVVSRFRRQFWGNKFLKAKLLKIFWLTVVTCTIFVVFYWPETLSRLTISSEEEAVRLRIFYNKESLGGGINLFGIGLGDFTGWLMEQNPNLPRHVYQPVHNIFLLIYSEIGVLGFVLFLLFLIGLFYEFIHKTKMEKLWHHSFLLVVLSIVFIGLFDHFLFTIQQGRFIFWLSVALLTSSLRYNIMYGSLNTKEGGQNDRVLLWTCGKVGR